MGCQKKIIKLIFSALILAFIYYKFQIDSSVFFEIYNYSYFLLAILTSTLLIPLLSVNRWSVFLEIQGITIKAVELLKINFQSIFLGLVLPSSIGYDILRIIEVEKMYPSQKGKGTSSVLIDRFLGFLMLSFIGLIFSVYSLVNNTIDVRIVVFIASVFLMLILIAIVLKTPKTYHLIQGFLKNFEYFSKISDFLSKLFSTLESFPLNTKVLFKSIPYILLIQFSSIVCCYLVFLSFNLNSNFFLLLSIIPIIQILTILPVSISGIGVREGLFVFFFQKYGYEPDILFAVSIVYFIIMMIVPALIGAVIYVFNSLNRKK